MIIISSSFVFMDNFKNTDFNALARSQTSIQMKMRLLALAHFQDGKSQTQIAQFLKVSRTSVNKWVHVYLTEGLAGLQEKPHTGLLALNNERNWLTT
ncbi:helix-turn-helix domain-containing protein [Shewanella benthica]|nr:helix-turn-helix domain-containing protein [Shewanella benthica]